MNKSNPKLYRELSLPFADAKIAEESATSFLEGVAKLREQFKIADVEVIIMGGRLHEGEEEPFFGSAHFGDSKNSEMMCAYGLAAARKDHEAMIGRALKSLLAKP